MGLDRALEELMWGERKKRTSYGIKAEEHLKRRFKIVSSGRTLIRSPASHSPADWTVIDVTGKPTALIQVKSFKSKGEARLSEAERENLINLQSYFVHVLLSESMKESTITQNNFTRYQRKKLGRKILIKHQEEKQGKDHNTCKNSLKKC